MQDTITLSRDRWERIKFAFQKVDKWHDTLGGLYEEGYLEEGDLGDKES